MAELIYSDQLIQFLISQSCFSVLERMKFLFPHFSHFSSLEEYFGMTESPSNPENWPEFLFWFAAGDHKHFQNFRFEELDALVDLFGVRTLLKDALLYVQEPVEGDPYAIIRLPSLEMAQRIAERSILTFAVFEVWASGESEAELEQNVTELNENKDFAKYFSKELQFCSRVRAYGRAFKHEDHLRIIRKYLSLLKFSGKVNLNTPQEQFWILFDYGHSHLSGEEALNRPVKRCFFTRRLCKSDREPLLAKYALSSRGYLGTTSTKAELAFLMANQALVKPGDFVLDPFVGTGSIALGCKVFGGFVWGSDIDLRALVGDLSDPEKRAETNIFTNFEQYGLSAPEIVRADSGNPVWRKGFQLDAIVCDPPYGVRAGARKTGTNKEVKEISDEHLETHIPRTQVYHVQDLMKDLFNFSARHLKMSGRIAFLLPTSSEYTDSDVPQHPCFKVVSNSEQVLTRNFRRRLVTMEKIKEPVESSEVYSQDANPSYNQLHDIFHKTSIPSKRKSGQ